MTGLRTIQHAFRAAVLSESDSGLHEITHAPQGSTATRIDVYRNTVQGSLVAVLAAAFPVVRRIVGGPFFDALCGRFVRLAPPNRPHLSSYGAAFPEFLAAEPQLAAQGYIADTARLEWARGEAYFAGDAPALEPAALSAIPEDRLADVTLAPHPTLRLIRSSYPIAHIWRVNQAAFAEVPAVDLTQAENVAVTRPQFAVTMRTVSAGDAAFIAALSAGSRLGEAVDLAYAAEENFSLEAALRDHLVHGSFTAVRG